jgi:uncharacterized protein YcbX
MTAKIVSLHLYPVKSLGGFPVIDAQVTPRGLKFDRRFLVVDKMGEFKTIRDIPAMATVKTAMDGEEMRMTNAFGDTVRVPLAPPPQATREVRVWSSHVQAHGVSDEANALLSDCLGEEVQLVYMPDSTLRTLKEGRGQPGDIVSFADGYPLLAASVSSLEDLNRRIAANGRDPVPMNRFRPNVVIEGMEPFVEDRMGPITIGNVAFRAASPCVRCQVTTTDQISGELRGPEPLATLSTFRRTPDGPMFGTNCIPDASGTIRVGDTVTWD